MQSIEEFPFPFSPYLIQNQFMKELYKCLENAKLGIFESPTGTGKSMSIICGALKWLLDYEEQQRNQLTTAISELDQQIKQYNNSSINWFFVQSQQIELNSKRQILQTKLNNIFQYEQRKNTLKEISRNMYNKKNSCNKNMINSIKDKDEIDNLIDKNDENEKIEEELLLEDMQYLENSEDEDKEEVYENTKIFFCSRTHSQLSQFIEELKKSPYSKNISVVTLTSRYFIYIYVYI